MFFNFRSLLSVPLSKRRKIIPKNTNIATVDIINSHILKSPPIQNLHQGNAKHRTLFPFNNLPIKTLTAVPLYDLYHLN